MPISEPARHLLTSRQQQVVWHITSGISYQRTAHRLGLSVHTVRSHMRAVHDRLGITNLADLTRWAIRHNIIKVTPL